MPAVLCALPILALIALAFLPDALAEVSTGGGGMAEGATGVLLGMCAAESKSRAECA